MMRLSARIACALLVALGQASISAAEPALQSQIVFGTTCARCHEGECSGRLTFDTGAAGAADHIGRHAGELGDGALLELRLPQQSHIHAEVLTRDFEPLADEPLVVMNGLAMPEFIASESSHALLRLHSQEPFLLEGVNLRAKPRDREQENARPEPADR